MSKLIINDKEITMNKVLKILKEHIAENDMYVLNLHNKEFLKMMHCLIDLSTLHETAQLVQDNIITKELNKHYRGQESF